MSADLRATDNITALKQRVSLIQSLANANKSGMEVEDMATLCFLQHLIQRQEQQQNASRELCTASHCRFAAAPLPQLRPGFPSLADRAAQCLGEERRGVRVRRGDSVSPGHHWGQQLLEKYVMTSTLSKGTALRKEEPGVAINSTTAIDSGGQEVYYTPEAELLCWGPAGARKSLQDRLQLFRSPAGAASVLDGRLSESRSDSADSKADSGFFEYFHTDRSDTELRDAEEGRRSPSPRGLQGIRVEKKASCSTSSSSSSSGGDSTCLNTTLSKDFDDMMCGRKKPFASFLFLPPGADGSGVIDLDAADRARQGSHEPHTVSTLAFFPSDGAGGLGGGERSVSLIAGTTNGRLFYLSSEGGGGGLRLRRRLEGHTGAITCISFNEQDHANGSGAPTDCASRLFLTTSKDNSIIIWRRGELTKLRRISNTMHTDPHIYPFFGCFMRNNNNYIAVVLRREQETDGRVSITEDSIRIFNISTGHIVASDRDRGEAIAAQDESSYLGRAAAGGGGSSKKDSTTSFTSLFASLQQKVLGASGGGAVGGGRAGPHHNGNPAGRRMLCVYSKEATFPFLFSLHYVVNHENSGGSYLSLSLWSLDTAFLTHYYHRFVKHREGGGGSCGGGGDGDAEQVRMHYALLSFGVLAELEGAGGAGRSSFASAPKLPSIEHLSSLPLLFTPRDTFSGRADLRLSVSLMTREDARRMLNIAHYNINEFLLGRMSGGSNDACEKKAWKRYEKIKCDLENQVNSLCPLLVLVSLPRTVGQQQQQRCRYLYLGLTHSPSLFSALYLYYYNQEMRTAKSINRDHIAKSFRHYQFVPFLVSNEPVSSGEHATAVDTSGGCFPPPVWSAEEAGETLAATATTAVPRPPTTSHLTFASCCVQHGKDEAEKKGDCESIVLRIHSVPSLYLSNTLNVRRGVRRTDSSAVVACHPLVPGTSTDKGCHTLHIHWSPLGNYIAVSHLSTLFIFTRLYLPCEPRGATAQLGNGGSAVAAATASAGAEDGIGDTGRQYYKEVEEEGEEWRRLVGWGRHTAEYCNSNNSSVQSDGSSYFANSGDTNDEDG